MFNRWMFAIYSSPSGNLPQRRKAKHRLRAIDRLLILRAIAPIRFRANKITESMRGVAFSGGTISRDPYAFGGLARNNSVTRSITTNMSLDNTAFRRQE
jgi:hypothetical protein